jgi:glycerol-3-phosphate dehydrogenase (NAD(P)+)
MKIAMIGAGGWGIAMIVLLAARNPDVTLYARNPDTAKELKKTRESKVYLPGVIIPDHVKITSDLEQAVRDMDCIVLCTPSKAIDETSKRIAPWVKKNAIVVCAAKGLANEKGLRLSQVIEQNLSGITDNVVALSGPNHAEEVGRGLPTATVAASRHERAVRLVQDIYMSPLFRVYRSDDIIGVEYGGALKNIIAIASGVQDGLGLGDNCRAALITRGLVEISRFGLHFGARSTTFYGLSGMGDLIATCTSTHSRNYNAGLKLARGMTMEEIEGSTSMIVEGFRTADIVHRIAGQADIYMPITDEVYYLMHGLHTPKEALGLLMNRSKKAEVDEGSGRITPFSI